MSQVGRSIILQLIVNFGWSPNLGDIKCAFLEADVSQQTSDKPVFAELPPGGAPGIAAGSLVQVLGNIYGANDAPHNWYAEFDSVARQAGFTRSKLDASISATVVMANPKECQVPMLMTLSLEDVEISFLQESNCSKPDFLSESGVLEKGNSLQPCSNSWRMGRSFFTKRNC
jgi:hypothetical protein